MEDQLLCEAALVEGTADRARREVMVDLIREGFGNKRDNHYYGRRILENAFQEFEGAKMYIDHLDPETARRMNGMPRSVKDLGGRILETELVTDDEGRTVIRGRAKIAQPWLWELIENDPGLLGVSINAWGKAKPGTVEGRQARIVEGISKVGSVDWVTEAGAGGKVVSLVEAQLEQEDEEPMVDSDLDLDMLAEERPDLYEDLVDHLVHLAEDDEEDLEDEVDEYEDDEEYYDDDGDPEAYADEDLDDDEEYEVEYEDDLEPAMAEALYETEYDDEEYYDDDDDYDVVYVDEEDPRLTEADLEADFEDLDEYVEARAHELAEAMLVEAVAAAVQVVQEQYEDQIVEMAESFNYELESREQRDAAARIIENTDLRPPTQAALKAEFHDRVFEAEVDEDGDVLASADEVLTRAVRRAIEDKRRELSEYTEARVIGAGESGATGGSHRERETRMSEGSPINNDIDSFLGIS